MTTRIPHGARTKAATRESKLTRRGHDRCNRILDIATRLFLRHGYSATALSQIVAQAGGSLTTLYRTFTDKEGLFLAIVQRKADSLFDELDARHAFDKPIEAGLHALAQVLLEFICTPDAAAIHRTLIGEGWRFPSLRRALYRKHATLVGKVAGYLRQQTQAGVLDLEDAEFAARQFISLVWLDVFDALAAGQLKKVSLARRRQICDAAVAMFLRGAQARSTVADRRSERSHRRRRNPPR